MMESGIFVTVWAGRAGRPGAKSGAAPPGFVVRRLSCNNGADSVTELELGMGSDVVPHLLPVILIIADAFAVTAHRQEPLELLDVGQRFFELANASRKVLLYAQHSCPHLNSSIKLVVIARFDDVIVGPRLQSANDVLARGSGGQQDDVNEPTTRQRADADAQRQPILAGHRPVEDGQQRLGGLLDDGPGLVSIADLDHVLVPRPQRRFQQLAIQQIVVGNENFHVSPRGQTQLGAVRADTRRRVSC
jgi:hypothetical protein